MVSQLLNEYFGREAGLANWQLGLGHAFEINPAVPDSFLLELAHAQLVRQLFPGAPLKYMPPTKYMTGNVFAGYLLDAFFNLCGALTDQSILLIGMMTEGIHTPFLSDRDLALENVRYVLRAAGRLGENFRPPPGGFIEKRAQQVLAESVDLLQRITAEGLLMYLQPDEALGLIAECAKRFPGGQMMFDLPPAWFASWARRGMRTSRRYRIPAMPFTLSVSQAADLVNTVPGIRAVHDLPMPAGRGNVLNALMWTAQRVPLLDPVRPMLTLLEFG